VSDQVTDEELKAAEARMAARKVLTDELDVLIKARDEARDKALIALTVAIDIECARGLRRKTFYGYDISPAPPREALRNIDKALTAWNEATSAPEIDAKLDEINATNEQYRVDQATVLRWLDQHS
jgi:hypothetical protein